MEWLKLIASILAGLATSIPLAIKLVEYVQKAAREKNWGKILDVVVTKMALAEDMLDNGAERKKWVLEMVKASAETIDYDIDMEVISKLVDDLCNLSKKVNVLSEEVGE